MAMRLCRACLLAIALSMIQLVCRQLAICMAFCITLFGLLASCAGALGSACRQISISMKRCDQALPVIERVLHGSSLPPASRFGRLRKKRVNRWVMEFDQGQDVAAREYVQENCSPEDAHKLLSRLVEPDLGRDIAFLDLARLTSKTISYNQDLAHASAIMQSIQ